jgi:hypothetical protein
MESLGKIDLSRFPEITELGEYTFAEISQVSSVIISDKITYYP